MTGSLQIKKNTYYVVLNFRDEYGKRKQKWINTSLPVKGNKRKAEQMLGTLLGEYSGKELVHSSSDALLSDYLLDWLERKKNKVELSTWESYYTYVAKHLAPYFEKRKLTLGALRAGHIMDYYEHALTNGKIHGPKGGLSVRSVKGHRLVLKAALDEAVLRELTPKNPVAGVPVPKRDAMPQERVFLCAEEANQLLQSLQGHPLREMVFVTLYYGLRRSEVLGIKWSAVDFEKDMLHIRHTVVKNSTVVAKDKTKSSKSRGAYRLLPECSQTATKGVSESVWQVLRGLRLCLHLARWQALSSGLCDAGIPASLGKSRTPQNAVPRFAPLHRQHSL